ncbi:MAG: hypothetical protein IJU55_00440 [Selenomonadaceae bacterium]|nr:hypothetical protein [Selenomonadaceae bacterium]
MRKIFFASAILIFSWLIIFSSRTNAEGVWRLDGTDKNELPKNFRLIEDLKASASGQPSLDGLKKIYEEVRKHTGSTIYIVDLREESHGFADKTPVSWYVEKNRGNYYRGYEKSYEEEQLKDLQGKLTEFVPLGNSDKKYLKPIKFSPKKTLSEGQAVEDFNSELLKNYASGKYFPQIQYARFPATDMIFPSPQVVDDFLSFVNRLGRNDWLHFHCHAGHGRTTTFLVFYEILKNPDSSLEEICHRQHLLGGSDLLAHSDGNDWYAQAHNDRAEKLRLFYRYMQLFRSGEISMSFSEFWQKEM